MSEHLEELRNVVGRADAKSRGVPAMRAPVLVARTLEEVISTEELKSLASAVVRKCRRLSAIMDLTFTGGGPDVEAARNDALKAIDAMRELLRQVGSQPSSPTP